MEYTSAIGERTPTVEQTRKMMELLKKKMGIAHRYGFRINENDSNPATRVEYIYDAVGMTPAHMDYTNGVFNYGSWGDKWFVTENKPLMLKSDGTVDYYLDPNNYTLKTDGTASDVTNTSYDGNAMAQFPLCWLKMWEEGQYNYCVVSDVQWDSDYKAYAHTRADGTIAPFFYWSLFGGSGDSSKIRSLSGKLMIATLTAAQEVAACQANGAKWYTHTWSQRTLITALLVLMGKNTDTQTVFGNGSLLVPSGSQTGRLKDKGQFFGYNSNNNYPMKGFHIENLWGNFWDRTAGFIAVSPFPHKIYVKMTPEGGGYQVDNVNGYTDTGKEVNFTQHEFISKMSCSEFGFIPTAGEGSDSTYYCDMANGKTDDGIYYLLTGGRHAGLSENGAFLTAMDTLYDTAERSITCGLSCEMPA